ncbi:hypothetical protein [Rickettsiella massiliensis]|uniref:hypothetical protein n=1 Tax=Rickettsiella massiliensis TaxID=676517 RepID=UPI00029A3E26|nr:hypothetical protein [Rickettsiella massiliensis]
MSNFFPFKPKQKSNLKSGDRADISATIKLAIGVRAPKQYHYFLKIKRTKTSLAVGARKIAKKITGLDGSLNQKIDNKHQYHHRHRILLFWLSNLLFVSIQSVKDKKSFRPEDKSFRKGVYGNGKNGDYSPTLGSRKLMVATCLTALISRILAVYAKPYAKKKH